MPNAFVSHIEEEAPLASVIKKWAESSFLRLFEVFVSSVPGDITAGNQWFHSLEAELNNSKAVLVICSPASVHRLWINFEAGAGWIKGIPVIPICHSGMTKAALPMPLVFFQALDAESEGFASELMSSLANHFGHEKPPVSQEMIADIKDALFLMRQHKESEEENGGEGILDFVVSLEDDLAEMAKILNSLGSFSSDLTEEILTFEQQASQLNTANPTGSTRQRQRIVSQFGARISQHAGRLTGLNEQYGKILPNVEQGLEKLMRYSSDAEEVDSESLNGMYATLDETEKSTDGLKSAVVKARESMIQTPNIQRDLSRGISNLASQLGILIAHLDRTLEMYRQGKAKVEVLRLRN